MAKKKKSVPTANVREDRTQAPAPQEVDAIELGTRRVPKTGATDLTRAEEMIFGVPTTTPTPTPTPTPTTTPTATPAGSAGTIGEENTATVDKGVGEVLTPEVPKFIASDGTVFVDQKSYQEYQDYIDDKRTSRQSAFDLLYEQFSSYGLGSLVEPLRTLIQDPSVSSSEFTIRLRQSDPYKKRFAANQERIKRGLSAVSEAEYLSLEDQYQNIMRNYGLPEAFYRKDTMGTQKGFESLIGFDVSAAELEDRIQQAEERVKNASPEVKDTLTKFYPGISNGDILAYVLDPANALTEIKRKITAAEIGAGAAQAGLGTTVARAEELAKYGITGAQAQRGFQAIAEITPRAEQLASFYKEAPYTQTQAEAEVFGTAGAVEAQKKRQRLVGREQAAFAGTSGAFQGALARDRAGAI